ncbi:MAG: inositol monophosphatase family protein [Nanoarchaeota archaeon]
MCPKYLEVGIEAVLKSSKVIMKYYNKKKPEINLDSKVEEILREIIFSYFPEHNFDGEENGLTINNSNSIYTWYCDPISSSNNFKRNLPHFAVSLSLFENSEQILGIVYDPACDEMFHALKGEGAFLNNVPIFPSQQNELKKSYFSCSMKKNSSEIVQICEQGASYKAFGSWALQFCYVASGRLDFVYTQLKDIHGTFSGLFIAKEAGCKFFDGRTLDYDLNSSRVLVTNSEKILTDTKKLFFK